MALEKYHIKQIDYTTAMDVIVREHYLHRKAPCSVAFGLFLAEELKGVAEPCPKVRGCLGGWRDECDRLHGGTCSKQHFHTAKCRAVAS